MNMSYLTHKTLKATFAFLLFLCTLSNTFASHIMGSDLTYVCLGNNQYRLRLTLYRDCAGVNLGSTASVSIKAPTCGINTSLTVNLEAGYPVEVSSVCTGMIGQTTCNGGSLQGVQEFVYSAVYTLTAQCTDWTFSYSNCCRNYSITTGPAGNSYYIQATLNNMGWLCNNSPDFTTKPVPFFGVNQPANYSHATVETDGDSLVYSLTNPLQNVTTPVTFIAPYNATYPISTTPAFTFPINPSTGQITFTPNLVQNGVLAVLVSEYRGGVLIGTVRRDIQIVIINGGGAPVTISPVTNLTGASVVGGSPNTFSVCAGVPMSFQVVVNAAPGYPPIITSNIAAALPSSGAAISTTGSNPKTVTFNWTPNASFVGYNAFSITATDNQCPIPSTTSVNYVIYVNGIDGIASNYTICQGQSTNLNAVVTGQAGGTYAWSPGTGLSATNIANPVANPPSLPYTYNVSYTIGGCTTSDALTIQASGTINATPSTTVTCASALPLQLNTSATLPVGSFACGAATGGLPCTGAVTLYTLGNGTTTSNRLFQQYFEDGRSQQLYLGTELTAAGIIPGRISSIAFNVSAKQSTKVYANFNVKIGCSALGSLSGAFQTGLVSVYSGSVTTTSGWNTLNFNLVDFQWDGVSNIIIEVCFDNGAGQWSQYDNVYCTTQVGNMVAFQRADNASGCSFAAPAFSNIRPNIRMNHCTIAPPITYAWSPSTGLNNPNIANPTANPPGDMTYIVTATRGGCSIIDTVVITTNNLASAATAADNFCMNQTSQLTTNTSLLPNNGVAVAATCGATASTCVGPESDIEVGINDPYQTNVGYPFFGYFEDSRSQYLYLASELTAAGVQSGLLTKLAFYVESKGSAAPYYGFNLRVKCTNATSLTGWEAGLTTVFTGSVDITTTGWKEIPFGTLYGWDGTSNLVVEVCWDNTGFSFYDYVTADTTTFNSVIYDYADGASGCSLNTVNLETIRPVIRLTNCSLIPPITYVWSPATALSNPNIANPIMGNTASGTYNYTVTVSNGPCSVSVPLQVTVQPCVLPVEELRASVLLKNENGFYVEVDWSTAKEVNTKNYQVQRRYSDETDFTTLQTTPAAGNSETAQAYNYTDNNLRPITAAQTIYYRIRVIDLNGDEHFSEMMNVKLSPSAEKASFTVYPNPTKEILNVSFDTNQMEDESVQFFIADNAGRVVQSVMHPISARNVALNVSSLSAGTYFLTVVTANGNKSFVRFVKI